ncbi:MAG: hypothetical protein ACOCXC_01345 [Fibrobacterota bacterium]
MALALTSTRTLFALITQKVITVWLGPAGLGQLGQFHSLWLVLQSLAGGGGQDGLIKLTAESNEHSKKRVNHTLVAFSIFTLVSSAVLGLVLFIFTPYVVRLFDFPPEWSPVLKVSALLMLFCGPWLCLQSYFTGLGRWSSLVIVQGIAAVTPVATLFILRFNSLDIGLFSPLAFSLPPLISVLGLSLLQVRRLHLLVTPFFNDLRFVLKTFWPNYKRLTLLVLPALLCGPLSLILVRHILVQKAGWELTGQFQALVRFFDLPVTLFVTFLSFYYVPALGKLKGKGHEDWSAYTKRVFILLVLFSLSILGLIPGKNQIFSLLFSDEISISSLWFVGFAVNTFLKLWAWIFGLQLLAFEAWKPYWVCESLGAVIWVALSVVAIPQYGVAGIIGAQTIELTFTLCALYVSSLHIKRKVFRGET